MGNDKRILLWVNGASHPTTRVCFVEGEGKRK